MVERVNAPVQLSTGNLGSGPDAYNPSRVSAERAQVEDSLALDALTGLLQIGEQGATNAFEADVKYQYMQGARARMLGQAFEDVESDPLSKPFIRGGFQDQDYRIQQAELQQKMTEYITNGKGRTIPPEQFMSELSAASQAVLEGMGDGLSNEGRAQALSSQVELEQSLLKAHGSAYKAYGVEQAGKRIAARGNSIITELGKAKVQGGDVGLAAQQAAGFFKDVFGSDTLPAEMREKVGQQFVQAMLSEDHRDVVEAMRDGAFFDEMGFDTRTKINEWMLASEKRTKAQDAFGAMSQAAQFEKQIELGQVDADDVSNYIGVEVAAGRLTADQQKALWDKFWTSRANSETAASVLQALNEGDVQALSDLGYTADQALDLYYEQAALQKLPVQDRAVQALRMGAQVGVFSKKAAADVNASVRALLLNPQEGNPAQSDLLTAYVDEATRLSITNPSAEATFIGALDRDVQPLMSAVMVDVQNGTDPVDSLRNAAAAQAAYERLTPEQRMSTQKKLETDIAERLNTGFFGQIASLATTGSRVQNEGQSFETMKINVHQEAMAIARQPQYVGLPEDAILKLAVARVQQRTIDVAPEGSKVSRVVLPRNVTLDRLAGTTDKAQIGAALSTLYPAESKDFQREFYMSAGRVMTVQVDSDGLPGVPEEVNWDKVRTEVTRKRDLTLEESRKAYNGQIVKDGDAQITISGRNSAGISKANAFQFRQELFKQEGLRLTVYEDTRGNATVGVGQNVQGQMKVGETVPAIVAERVFMDQSDKAMLQGTRLAKSLGVTAAWGQLALSGAIFQLGQGGVENFDGMLDAIRNKDLAKFEQEARNSKWNEQTPERVEWFISRMKGHFLSK